VLIFITLCRFIQKLYNKTKGSRNYESPCTTLSISNNRKQTLYVLERYCATNHANLEFDRFCDPTHTAAHDFLLSVDVLLICSLFAGPLGSDFSVEQRVPSNALKKIPNFRCSVSSTGCVCGSLSGSRSGYASWCTAAFMAPRRHLADSLRRTADVDGRHRLRSSVSDTLVVAPTNRSNLLTL